MKTLIGVIALMFVLLFGASNGVIAAEKAASPATEKSKLTGSDSGPSELKDSLMTGKVTHVDANKKTFTIMAKGKQKTFSVTQSTIVNNLKKTLPKVGEIVDVTYTATPGGAMQATTVKSSKSNSSD